MRYRTSRSWPVSTVLCLLMFCSFTQHRHTPALPAEQAKQPRIVNIVNFVRLLEPRDPKITEDTLYQTVLQQVRIMRKYKLKGSFLLQYDALLDARYQALFRSLPADSFDIGAWWEIPQPLVEHAGLVWRGRYPWDWRANIGFSTGYSPAEREKLTDVYMRDFKKIFGRYPRSVASWFIDAHSLEYMSRKYHIVASANCKDQIGTDGYTLWGGYWNQAYYPSKINAYMPAQHAENQIPVPIFRMLGSDPVRQYDNGLGGDHQGVVTLEPVYRFGGGDSTWVDWYFKEFISGQSLAFAYVQAGQENSFTWRAMAKGFEIQMPLIARLRDEQKIRVETLAESGTWFREHYPVTPPSSVTINEDLAGSDRKTVWFNSRFYRINLLWENNGLRFRDIHLFNEDLPSPYIGRKADSDTCSFLTLPFIDGYRWSTKDNIAGLRLLARLNGKEIAVEGGDPVVDNPAPGILHIAWPLTSFPGTLEMDLDERQIKIRLVGAGVKDWFLDLRTAAAASLPFTKISASAVDCRFLDMPYRVSASAGIFSVPQEGSVFRITPEANAITLDLSGHGLSNKK